MLHIVYYASDGRKTKQFRFSFFAQWLDSCTKRRKSSKKRKEKHGKKVSNIKDESDVICRYRNRNETLSILTDVINKY